MATQLTLLVNSQDEIERSWERDTLDVGPFKYPSIPSSYRYVMSAEPFDAHAPPTASSVAMHGVNGPYWLDAATLAQAQARALIEVDLVADAARLAVVGDAARIKEYERAQLGAEQYRDAGYTGTVPPPVASWAHAKRRDNWTAKQAADDILAASARWYAALDGIRAMRLDAKESIRASVTNAEVAATAATFRSTLTAAMQGVQ